MSLGCEINLGLSAGSDLPVWSPKSVLLASVATQRERQQLVLYLLKYYLLLLLTVILANFLPPISILLHVDVVNSKIYLKSNRVSLSKSEKKYKKLTRSVEFDSDKKIVLMVAINLFPISVELLIVIQFKEYFSVLVQTFFNTNNSRHANNVWCDRCTKVVNALLYR